MGYGVAGRVGGPNAGGRSGSGYFFRPIFRSILRVLRFWILRSHLWRFGSICHFRWGLV